MTQTIAKLVFTDSNRETIEWTIEVLKVSWKYNKNLKVHHPGLAKFMSEAFGDKVFPAITVDWGQTAVQWVLDVRVTDPTWQDQADVLTDIMLNRERILRDAFLYTHIYLVFTNVKESDDVYTVSNSTGIEVKLNTEQGEWNTENLYYSLSLEVVEGFDFDF